MRLAAAHTLGKHSTGPPLSPTAMTSTSRQAKCTGKGQEKAVRNHWLAKSTGTTP